MDAVTVMGVQAGCEDRGPRREDQLGSAANVNDRHPRGAWLRWAMATIMMVVREVACLIKVGIHGHRPLARPGELERSHTSPGRTHRWQLPAISLATAWPSRSAIATMAGATTAGDASWMTNSGIASEAARRARGISRTEAKSHPTPRRACMPLLWRSSRAERDGEAPTAFQDDLGVI